MTMQSIEDLAKLYGIEINIVTPGKGGLFYTDSNNIKIELDHFFDIDTTLRHEILPFVECNAFFNYPEEDLMNQAA